MTTNMNSLEYVDVSIHDVNAVVVLLATRIVNVGMERHHLARRGAPI